MKGGPMKNILEFLGEYEEFKILKFDEDMIFNKPIEVFFFSLTSLGLAQMRCLFRFLLEPLPPRKSYPIRP